jgi:hypothetical protein
MAAESTIDVDSKETNLKIQMWGLGVWVKW